MEQNINDKKEKLSFRQFLNVVWWLIGFNFKMSPSGTVLYTLISIFTGLDSLIGAYIFAKLLDGIIKTATNSVAKPTEIIPLLILYLVYKLTFLALGSVYNYLANKMSYLADFKSIQFLTDHIHSLGIQTLENPEVANKIQRTKETIRMVFRDFDGVAFFITRLTALLLSSFVILKTMPIILILIFASMLPKLISNRIYMRKSWQYIRATTEERRVANMINTSLSESSNLQEITIASVFRYLHDKYKTFIDKYIKENMVIIKKWNFSGFMLGSLTEITSIFGYFNILKNLFNKLISVGDATFQMRSLDIFTDNLSRATTNFVSLFERSIRLKEAKEVFSMKPMIEDGHIELEKCETAPEIKFSRVSFKYLNTDDYVIKNLSLDIKPGEKIAIVGENGAGKTTLVKLLSRFYKVDKGNIFLNDKNINDIKIDSWYKNLGVLFQDYNTYSYLTLKENIYLGESGEVLDMEKIKLAAKKADVDSFVGDYKHGYEQVLSEKFKGGKRPSTGQWQKIAIARFFYRDSPVVVFDEPTASIDAVSESRIFSQIYDLFKGKTVIIISHRFSTVRNADRIYVLDKGQIVEKGTHGELMKKKGRYAKAFKVQAEGYQ
ncbi:MAG: Uncharacterized protein Athens071426_29 [Parcubacteria group bacterium Athens0714_26]|nr:MAG: Uncharacterized protein Athens071426_29 [Parcubacteria group bacterium Athens0714_26]